MSASFLPQGKAQFLPKRPGGFQPPELRREVAVPLARVTQWKDEIGELGERVDWLVGELDGEIELPWEKH